MQITTKHAESFVEAFSDFGGMTLDPFEVMKALEKVFGEGEGDPKQDTKQDTYVLGSKPDPVLIQHYPPKPVTGDSMQQRLEELIDKQRREHPLLWNPPVVTMYMAGFPDGSGWSGTITTTSDSLTLPEMNCKYMGSFPKKDSK
jgi:hypothetical protein